MGAPQLGKSPLGVLGLSGPTAGSNRVKHHDGRWLGDVLDTQRQILQRKTQVQQTQVDSAWTTIDFEQGSAEDAGLINSTTDLVWNATHKAIENTSAENRVITFAGALIFAGSQGLGQRGARIQILNAAGALVETLTPVISDANGAGDHTVVLPARAYTLAAGFMARAQGFQSSLVTDSTIEPGSLFSADVLLTGSTPDLSDYAALADLAAAGGAGLVGAAGSYATVQAAINASVTYVASTTALKAVLAAGFVGGEVRQLTESGKAGAFVWTLGNFTTETGLDTTGGVYIKADDVAVTSGVWVRRYQEPINASWFGVVAGGADTTSAMQALAATVGRGYLAPGAYNVTVNIAGRYFSDGVVTFSGAGTFSVSDINRPHVDTGGRSVIQYKNANEVYLRDAQYPMAGFRFHGRYLKQGVPNFTPTSQQSVASFTTGLAFGMSSVVLENWYGVFAVADEGDANCAFEIVPFLRIKSALGGGQFDLNKAGEAIHSAVAQTYTWAADALNGAELLCITETIDGRVNNWSGRVTTVTDSTTTAITVADAGSLAAMDFVLPAPVGYDHYRYCGAVYYDTGEIRNLADDGRTVRSRGISDQSVATTGQVTNVEMEPAGYISPLATSVYIQSTCVLSTASEGQYVEGFYLDSSDHEVSSFIYQKDSVPSPSLASHDVVMPFVFGQKWFFTTLGALVGARINGQQRYWGWIEP